MPRQQTLARPCAFTGIALHNGGEVQVRLLPAEEGEGVIFHRVDVNQSIRAHCRLVGDTHLATVLHDGGVSVFMVEHFLSAAYAAGIDNVRIELNGNEMPILDGSASPWMILFDRVGIRRQGASRRRIRVKKPVIVSEGEREARFEPSIAEECHFDVTIDYPHKVIHRGGTRIRCDLDSDTYLRQIARARTFCYVKDVEWMQRHNRARGGSLQNAVVFDDEGVINEEGLRYPDEFVRHKVLDAVGDCYINGQTIMGRYRSVRPGHDLNNRLIRALLDDREAWEEID